MITDIFNEVPDVRADVAKSPRISEADAWALASDPHSYVRAALAANPNIPADLLDRLSKDLDSNVRGAVARNPSVTPEQSYRLAEDDRTQVIEEVARSIYTPLELLRKLRSTSGNVWVRQYAKETIKKLSRGSKQ